MSFFLASAFGCSPDLDERRQLVSGVEPVWEQAQAWYISADPVVSVGAIHGATPYVFGKVTDATVLSDGRFVIADNQSLEIRYYDSRGQYLFAAGREGEGPGEFNMVSVLTSMPGDTVVVFDPLLDRASVLDSRGNFVRSVRLPTDGYFHAAFAIDPRTILIVDDLAGLATYLESSGLIRDDRRISLLDLDSDSLTTVAVVQGSERIRTLRPGRVSHRTAPFARSTYVTASQGRYFIGNATADSITVFDIHGRPTQHIGGVRAIHAVTPSDVDRYYQTRYSPEGRKRIWARQDYHDAAPPTTPAYRGLVADAKGNLWVCRFQPWWDDSPTRWDVHDPTGRWLGTVELPVRMQEHEELLEVGADYVLLLLRDDLDVERVARYRLIKPGSGPGP